MTDSIVVAMKLRLESARTSVGGGMCAHVHFAVTHARCGRLVACSGVAEAPAAATWSSGGRFPLAADGVAGPRDARWPSAIAGGLWRLLLAELRQWAARAGRRLGGWGSPLWRPLCVVRLVRGVAAAAAAESGSESAVSPGSTLPLAASAAFACAAASPPPSARVPPQGATAARSVPLGSLAGPSGRPPWLIGSYKGRLSGS